MNLFAKSPSRRHQVCIARAITTSRLLPGRIHPRPHRKSIKTSSIPIAPIAMSQPTFQLWEFSCLSGYDMHHLVLLQRTSNESSLSNLRHNLQHSIASGEVVVHDRVYTQQDVLNIQSSAVDIIQRFESTNDSVDLLVASGELDVKINEGEAETSSEEAEWFEGVFDDAKFPRWEKLGGRVVSLFEGEYQPEE